MLPTSHVKVSRGGVAHSGAVAGDTFILPLVCLLAAFNLQATWEERRRPQQRHNRHHFALFLRESNSINVLLFPPLGRIHTGTLPGGLGL